MEFFKGKADHLWQTYKHEISHSISTSALYVPVAGMQETMRRYLGLLLPFVFFLLFEWTLWVNRISGYIYVPYL